jgi:hypothetical protein
MTSIASAELDTHGKALSINLDPSSFGTLAEIGAGQEVARWFLSVGAASGTVAKTISAYDKVISDEIYGAGTRYVSRERLLAMLDREYRLLLERLDASRGRNTQFFAFADTVASRNYKGDNEQHGWLGIRFQTEPNAPPSQMLLHVNLRDATAQLQMQSIGVLGVNLIYGAYHLGPDIDTSLRGLFDALSIDRIEIDVIELSGPAFTGQDACAWCLTALRRGMAHALILNSSGHVVEPSSLLRKRPLLVMRGTFRNPELLQPDLFESARRQLIAEGVTIEREPVTLIEMTTSHVSREMSPPVAQMQESVRQLASRGLLMVTSFPETYLLSRYLRRHSNEPVRFVVSVAGAAKILQEAFYQDLPGTLLEGVGKLLATNVKLYVAPMPREALMAALGNVSGTLAVRRSGDGPVRLDDLMPAEPGCHLFHYLRAAGRIVELQHSQ